MPSLFAFAASAALVLPFFGQAPVLLQPGAAAGMGYEARLGERSQTAPDYEQSPESPYWRAQSGPGNAATPLDAFNGGQILRQFRIEERVIIRISPARRTNRNSMLAQLPARGLNTRFEEREMDRCLPVNRIAGVQTGNGTRLLLFLNDQSVVSLNLERSCRAREFYSGFYVERNDDGQLCVDRDKLQSRSGARCEIERMRQLVAISD